MNVFEALEKRRTIRDFKNEPISDETIYKIIDAAFKAPSNDHMRDWHFIVIKDKEVMDMLLNIVPKEFSDNDLNELFTSWNLNDKLQQECYRNAVPKQYRMLRDASFMLIPLFKQKVDLMHPDNLSHLNGFASIWCAIENIYLAVTELGLGMSLRIPLGNEGEHSKKVLGYPDDYLMPCFLGIGVPSDEQPNIKQKNIDISSRIHIDKWHG